MKTIEPTKEDLTDRKNQLLNQVDEMVKLHKSKYSGIDISQPKSDEEKNSDKQIAALYSQINTIVKQLRKL